MSAKNVYYFATRSDMEPGLRSFETQNEVSYVDRGLFPTQEPTVFQSFGQLPSLGTTIGRPNVNLQPFYLVLKRSEEVRVRSIPQRRGPIYYGIDEVANPSAMIFVPSGVYAEAALIVGILMRTSDPRCHDLFRAFSQELLKGFKRVGKYYIGPDALRMAKRGCRLTHAANTSPDYDIRLPGEC